MLRWGNDSTALAIGLLLFGGGALILGSLFGVWASFSFIIVTAFGVSAGAEAQRRRILRGRYEQREWRRIVWEEWGYRSE